MLRQETAGIEPQRFRALRPSRLNSPARLIWSSADQKPRYPCEVLNGFCVINEKHLDYLLKVGTDWYNNRRGHSARDHLPPIRDKDSPPTVDLTKQKLVCVEELGGHLQSYRAAA